MFTLFGIFISWSWKLHYKNLVQKEGISIVGVQADEVAIPLVVMEEREKGKGQRENMSVYQSLQPEKEVEVLTKTSLGIQG